MRILISFLIMILCHGVVISQELNAFDADGKRHGSWKKYFDETKLIRYEGQFDHGKEIGTFKFYKKIRNRAVLSATKTFNKNDNTAQVKFLASNGKVISEGTMDGKIYVGTWKYFHKNSDALLTIEHYNNTGVLINERLVYYPNGQIAEKQTYNAGKLEGNAIWYSLKNVVMKHLVYSNGELHGPAKFFNPKGELISEGQYKRDKKDGVWKYYENGKLVREKDFTYIPKYIKKTP
ncbi:toxin-antitoxin system YwqK family antitoxin [Algibacter mikhailovii]|uniref:toxin-antitoxin system YwqK family antitoxin n=1 Tax=Algibacter mikhailovii TaxID=425498 RepID=UPI002493E404|nr:toxin-antitoxin system YwqK family antitoxin [Algibacter mikhailovii]